MKLTRRRLFEGAVAVTLGGIGIDALVERLTGTPRARLRAAHHPIEQHLLPHARTLVDDGVELLVPPLHHRVITARLRVAESPAALREARVAFERALAQVEATAEPPAVTVAWGLPYFRRFVPAQAQREIPVDRRASGARGRPLRVLEDAERFPSDPGATMLEDNDVAVLLRSDHLAAIDDAQRRMFDELPEIFRVTSVRKGFVGGGFGGRRSLPKRMVGSAGVPGADLMPAGAQLFLGFTSSVKRALGPPKIANFESLGYADLPSGYFVGGTHMHLSHIAENLLAWYLNFDHGERVHAMFRPGLEVPVGALTVRQAPADVQTIAELHRDYARVRRIGHAGAIQPASRLDRDVVSADGTIYRKGTAVPQRADFNTLDNPFAWSVEPIRDGLKDEPAAGVHFVVFNPSSDDFRRVRLAMDGILPDGSRVEFEPRSIGQGLNSVLRTTHRQNFLVPPRAHRSFPLSELRA
jgi:hypothetical protein